MALAFLLIAIVLLVTAFLNTQGLLGDQLIADGPGYLKWAAAIIAIGLVGYIPAFSKASKLFLALILLVIIIVNKGLFANLQSAFDSPGQGVTPPAPPTVTGSPTITIAGGSGSSNPLGSIVGAIGPIASIVGG